MPVRYSRMANAGLRMQRMLPIPEQSGIVVKLDELLALSHTLRSRRADALVEEVAA